MMRLAQQVGAAPDKLRGQASGGDKIPNQRPVAELAARHFSEDLRHFVRAYAGVVPRHAFVEMLEACMAVGLTTILSSVVELLFDWVKITTVAMAAGLPVLELLDRACTISSGPSAVYGQP